MNLRKLVINSLFLAIGAVLHQLTPPIFLSMKPDFSLAMLFIIIIINDDYKTCISSGIIAGILAAATTSFPGGQLPNIIDRIVTTTVIFIALKPLRNKLNDKVQIIGTTLIGTVISGGVFLGSALIIVGLPGSFKSLFMAIVLPATIINTIAAVIVFVAVQRGRAVVFHTTK